MKNKVHSNVRDVLYVLQVLWLFVVKTKICMMRNMHSRYTYRKLNLKFVFNQIRAWNKDLYNYIKDVTKPYNRKYPKLSI